jgi:hypothetical protein
MLLAWVKFLITMGIESGLIMSNLCLCFNCHDVCARLANVLALCAG